MNLISKDTHLVSSIYNVDYSCNYSLKMYHNYDTSISDNMCNGSRGNYKI